MKILLGTHYLAGTGSTENYTYALATELKRLGTCLYKVKKNRVFVSKGEK